MTSRRTWRKRLLSVRSSRSFVSLWCSTGWCASTTSLFGGKSYFSLSTRVSPFIVVLLLLLLLMMWSGAVVACSGESAWSERRGFCDNDSEDAGDARRIRK